MKMKKKSRSYSSFGSETLDVALREKVIQKLCIYAEM